MLVIPAIDLKAGRCVRLYQGDMDQATIYSDNPVATALRWQSEGAERLHIVDLDGAVSGAGVNTGVIEQICQALTIPVQVGGGIRHLDAVEKFLSRGVARVILGTVAYRQPEVVATACQRFPGHITVGIDARAGKVAVQGWTEATELEASALARRCSGGVASVRDIERLAPLESEGIVGVIIGRALYTGAVKLTEAIAIARGLTQ